MTIQSQITELLRSLEIKSETKNYWLSKISSLSQIELKRLHRILMAKTPGELDRYINQEIKYQETLKDKIKKIPSIIRKLFQDAEKEETKEKDPEEILKQKLKSL